MDIEVKIKTFGMAIFILLIALLDQEFFQYPGHIKKVAGFWEY